MLEKKNYIEGIYNYCNRWCEKCSFTANCILFTNESKIQTYEILNDNKLPDVEDIFKDDIEDQLDDEESGYEDFEEDFSADELEYEKRHELSLVEDLSNKYFQKAYFLIKAISNEYSLTNLSNSKNVIDSFKKLFGDFEIFSWYCGFIGAKLMRAIFNERELQGFSYEDSNDFLLKDMNGSAKIGIIAIKKSDKALNNLFDFLPKYRDEIEELLILLGKLLNEAENKFPAYKNFKRPGFDDEQ